MAADAKMNNLKMAVVARFNQQLQSLQKGHPYKTDEVLNQAIEAIKMLEGCGCDPKYIKLIDFYCLKLKR